MDADRARIEELAESARRLPVAERRAFLEVRAAYAIVEAQQRMWLGLDVKTARDILADYSRFCHVTLFLDRLFMASVAPRPMELQLDMSRYLWLVMRSREPAEQVRVSDWQLQCYGNRS